MMKVKVCGMREAENIREVEALGIDWLGLIFWPRSKRYVAQRPAYLPEQAKRVGVFVDTTIEDIAQHAKDYGLDFVQLHGHESPAFVKQLRETIGQPLIKAFNIAAAEDFLQTEPYERLTDYFLFDTRKPTEETGGRHLPGGTGEKFDWAVLTNYHGETPFILSGGIGPDDAECVKSFHQRKCVGIDLNSRFETAPAIKDIKALRFFLEALGDLGLPRKI